MFLIQNCQYYHESSGAYRLRNHINSAHSSHYLYTHRYTRLWNKPHRLDYRPNFASLVIGWRLVTRHKMICVATIQGCMGCDTLLRAVTARCGQG